jgi:RNA polymerase sigma-70 factor (ECF subfamily)
MVEGPEAGLRLLSGLELEGDLRNYHLLPATQAHMHYKLAHYEEAGTCYRKALSLASNDADRRFLRQRLAEIEARYVRSSVSDALPIEP